MKKTLVSVLVLALVGCQNVTSTDDSAMPQVGTDCEGRFLDDSLILNFVPYGSSCPVPDTVGAYYGAATVAVRWKSLDGNCLSPRATDMADEPVKIAGCLKKVPRWMYDTIPTPYPSGF